VSSRPATPDPVQIAGRYDVVQKLGAGAFGTVYKAKDKLLGRMVAIKTIRLEGLAAQGASLQELLDRFNREARVSAQLKHPNIVTVYDVGNSDGLTYLAMEFIDGQGLDRLIANEGRLPVERAALIAAQVADGLDFAHKNGVVHRDIKPANIMIESGDRVKVTDFGIAKATDSGEHLTVTGSLLGTPSYMSPEQAKGAALDGRSDLFSVGCVLYEMLAGKKAFRGDSITGLIFKIITEEPPSITEIDPLIPEAMVKIITKALNKVPDARYQTGRELADDLLALTRGGAWPTMRQTETPTAAGMPSVAPPPTIVAPAGVVSPPTVATTPTVVSGTKPNAPAPRPAPAPARPTPSPRPAPPPARSGGLGGLLIVGGVGLVLVLVLAAAGGWYFWSRSQGTTTAGTPTPAPAVTPAPETPVPSAAPTAAATAEPTAANTNTTAGQTPAAATLPPTTARTPSAVDAATPKPVAPSTSGGETGGGTEYAYLDQEEEGPSDGAAMGSRLSGAYSSDRGGPSSRMGTSAHLNRRPRSPKGLRANEIPAVATLRHLINAEKLYEKRHNGHYGSLSDLVGARFALLDVKHNANGFERRGYRFELMVKDDGFEVVAMPQTPGPRAFKGDDSEFIVVGLD
jgi:serine/threonine-protein kinase